MRRQRMICRLVLAGLLLGACRLAAAPHPGTAGGCRDCHPRSAHGSDPAKGASHQDLDCLVCHDVRTPTANLAFVRETITAPDGVTLPVVFTARTGPGSFADGDSVRDGVCEVCHDATFYHRRDGGDVPHHDGEDCTACHPHADGFVPMGGTCMECHSHPQPAGEGYRRQVVEWNGDGGGDFVRASHHVDDGSGGQSVTDADCLVCHDMSRHRTLTDGVSVLLRDPAGGDPILYDGSPASVDSFCLACHDGTHDAPFSEGRPAPDHTGFDFRRHHDPHCLKCHGNGHGSDNLALVRNEVDAPDSVRRAVRFTAYSGPGSFADGDTLRDGLCEVCHLNTRYHDVNGTGPPHHGGEDCRACHEHDIGFHPTTGSCLVCHGTAELAAWGEVTGVPAGGAGSFLSVFPSPSGGEVAVTASLPAKAGGGAVLEIFDLRGRRLRRLAAPAAAAAGRAVFHWDGRDGEGQPVTSGVYLLRLRTAADVRSALVTILR